MVKETKYRHHPVRLEKGLFLGLQQLDIVGVRLAFLDDVLHDDDLAETTGWTPMNLNTLVVAKGATVPRDAVAVILDVEVWDDAASGEHYMQFASVEPDANTSNQDVPAGKTQTVYRAQAAGRKGSRIVIVELSEDFCIRTKIAGSAPNAFNYSINLIGWLIGGTRISKVTWPSVDLYAKFTI